MYTNLYVILNKANTNGTNHENILSLIRKGSIKLNKICYRLPLSDVQIFKNCHTQ